MFTLPPLPPKDYVIKDVLKQTRSSSVFTPESLPRITQTNFGKFCSPIQYTNLEIPEKKLTPISPQFLDKLTNENRASWVPKPGEDDFFLHNVCKQYSSVVDVNYDPRFQHKEKIFNRSLKYEFEIMENERLQKLFDKCKTEHENFIKSCLGPEENLKEKPKIVCKNLSPFWWIEPPNQIIDKNTEITTDNSDKDSSQFGRWQDEPNFFLKNIDPGQRRRDMFLIGVPFRNEACRWYNEHYPPTEIKFIPKKFSK